MCGCGRERVCVKEAREDWDPAHSARTSPTVRYGVILRKRSAGYLGLGEGGACSAVRCIGETIRSSVWASSMEECNAVEGSTQRRLESCWGMFET